MGEYARQQGYEGISEKAGSITRSICAMCAGASRSG